MLDQAGESGLDNLLREIVGKRDGLRWLHRPNGIDGGGFQLLFREFGFGAGETADGDSGVGLAAAGIRPGRLRRNSPMPRERSAPRPIIDNILPRRHRGIRRDRSATPPGAAGRGLPEGRRRPYAAKFFNKALRERVPDLMER